MCLTIKPSSFSPSGIYIPEILAELDSRGTIKVAGAAIGDGCWGNQVGTCGIQAQADRISVEFYQVRNRIVDLRDWLDSRGILFLQGMGMYPQTLYTQIKATCGNFTNVNAQCRQLVTQMNKQIGSFDICKHNLKMDLFLIERFSHASSYPASQDNVFDTCGNDQALPPAEQIARVHQLKTFSTTGFQSFNVHPQLAAGVGGALNDYACGAETVMSQWLSQPSVQQALHVDHQGQQTYSRTAADLRPLYKSLAQKYRILIYSGSVDACVPCE